MSTDPSYGHGEPASAGEIHATSWSANLETPAHEGDPDRIVEGALNAIEHTVPGNHVNLVTHGEAGHPETYLFPALEAAVPDLEWTYVDRCGCGGYVTRVHV